MGRMSDAGDAYLGGRYVTAYRTAMAAGLMREHDDPDECLMAARILRNVGGVRRARLWILRNWRRHRDHWFSRIFRMYEIYNPVRALIAMDRMGDVTSTDRDAYQDWLLLRARAHAELRDFQSAEHWWRRAQELGDSGWLYQVRGAIESERDQLVAALDAVDRALEVKPWYGPAVRLKVTLLRRARLTAEALAFARESIQHVESYDIAIKLHHMHWEQGEYRRALESLEMIVELAPAMERSLHDWLAYRFAKVAYLAGDAMRPKRLAEALGSDELVELAEACGNGDERRRVHLPVPAVPQKHNTCGPASLTSVAEYWDLAVEHEELVEEICRDGTSHYSERRWLLDRAWVPREFTVTWTAARALLDARFPFAFVTTGELAAHLQVAMGYDAIFATILVRDPGSLSMYELPWTELEKKEGVFGPRGLVFVPQEHAKRLRDMDLPDARLYDLLFEVSDALESHDRERADQARHQLRQNAPTHTVTLRADRAMAAYDGDPAAYLDWARAMFEKAPEDARLQVQKLSSMEGLASPSEQLAEAMKLARDSRSTFVLAELASLLSNTTDQRARVGPLLWRVLDRAFTSARSHSALADHEWNTGDRKLATQLYRFASCLADHDEWRAWSYFLACRSKGEAERGLDHLRGRVQRLGALSSSPARTLADAYETENRHEDAIAVLEDCERSHAEDAELLLGLAEHSLSIGQRDRARDLLSRAKGKVRRSDWLRSAARLARLEGDLVEAVSHWREVAAAQPLAMSVQRDLAGGIAETQGVRAAVAHLGELVERFPHHIGLARLHYEYLCEVDEHLALECLLDYSSRHPEDCWGHREICFVQARGGDAEAGLERLARAAALGDVSASWFLAEGAAHEAMNDAAAARISYRHAVERLVDATRAIDAWMALATTASEATRVLDEVLAQLLAQPTDGSGVMAYFEHASRWINHETHGANLGRLAEAHPCVFEPWLARVRHRQAGNDLPTALQYAKELTERFPLLAGSWRTLAAVQREAGELEQQIESLHHALALSPAWASCMRELADAHEELGEQGRAREVLERAVMLRPRDSVNRGYLADLLWRTGEREAALDEIERAVEIDPGYRWAWETLARWCEDPRQPIELARRAAQSRGASSAVWIALAELMPHATLAMRLECLDEAIRREPASVEARDLKAKLLSEAGQHERGLQACQSPLWETPPLELRGRSAWILHERGDRAEARAKMLELIQENPDYSWGINTVLAWAEEEDESLIDVCSRLIRTAPGSVQAHARLGEAYREDGQYEAAGRAFFRARELEPRHRFTLLSLADLYLDQSDPGAAGEALDPLSEQDVAVIIRRCRVFAQQGDPGRVCTYLDALLRRDDLDAGVVSESLADYGDRRLPRKVRSLLGRWMQREDAGAHVGEAWLWHVGRRLPAPLLWRRMRRFVESRARASALACYVEELGESGRRFTLRLFGFFHGRLLRCSTVSWGSMAYALACIPLWSAVVRWFHDHKSREGVRSWMLWNLALAGYHLKRPTLAAAAHRDALELPDDVMTHRHRLCLAASEAIDGDTEAAVKLMNEAVGPRWTETDHFLIAVGRALLEWRQSIDGDGRYEAAGSALRAAKAQLGTLQDHPDCLAVYNCVVDLLRRRRGGVAGRLWWFRMQSFKT